MAIYRQERNTVFHPHFVVFEWATTSGTKASGDSLTAVSPGGGVFTRVFSPILHFRVFAGLFV